MGLICGDDGQRAAEVEGRGFACDAAALFPADSLIFQTFLFTTSRKEPLVGTMARLDVLFHGGGLGSKKLTSGQPRLPEAKARFPGQMSEAHVSHGKAGLRPGNGPAQTIELLNRTHGKSLVHAWRLASVLDCTGDELSGGPTEPHRFPHATKPFPIQNREGGAQRSTSAGCAAPSLCPPGTDRQRERWHLESRLPFRVAPGVASQDPSKVRPGAVGRESSPWGSEATQMGSLNGH